MGTTCYLPPRIGAECPPDAELSRALRDAARGHAVNAQHNEEQRRRGEYADERQHQPALRERIAHGLAHRPHIGDRLAGIDAVNRLPYGRRQTRRITDRTNRHGEIAVLAIRVRHVQLAAPFLLQVVHPDVADDADHVQGVAIDDDGLAVDTPLREIALRDELVDDGDFSQLFPIARLELSATENRYPHCLEITWRRWRDFAEHAAVLSDAGNRRRTRKEYAALIGTRRERRSGALGHGDRPREETQTLQR